MAYSTGGVTFLIGGEWTASHWDGIGIETVGTLAIVGVEQGRGVEIAITHDDAVVKTDDDGHPVVYGGPFDVALLSLVVAAVEEGGTTLFLLLDGAEGAGCHRVHCRSECGIVVQLVVDEDITRPTAVFIGDVGATDEQQ